MFDLDIADGPAEPSGTGRPLWLEVHGPIDRSMAERITAELTTHAEVRALHVDMASPGGEVGPAFDIYCAIRNHRAAEKSAYIAQSKSAAVLVAIAADRRVLMPSGKMMLHSVQIAPIGRWTAEQHERTATDCRWWDGQVARLLAYRTGTPVETFLREMTDENPAQPEWLMATGVITEIMETK